MAGVFVIQGVLNTSAADTFTQLTLLTGLTGTDNSAFRIKELLLEHPTKLGTTGFLDSQVQITRGSKAALVDYSDTSLILRSAIYQNIQGAAFAVTENPVIDIVPQSDLIIVETQIFLGVKTTLFAAVAKYQYKLILEEIKISADQRINILSSRLP